MSRPFPSFRKTLRGGPLPRRADLPQREKTFSDVWLQTFRIHLSLQNQSESIRSYYLFFLLTGVM